MAKHSSWLAIGALAIFALVLSACSSEADAKAGDTSSAGHEPVEAQHSAMQMSDGGDNVQLPQDDGTIQVDETVRLDASEFKFSPADVTIHAGDQVRLVLNNVGVVPHEIAIDGMPAEIIAVQDPAAMGETDEDEMAEMGEMAASGIVHVHAASGNTASEVFKVTEPGTYDFACEIQGHEEAGMVGTLTVLP